MLRRLVLATALLLPAIARAQTVDGLDPHVKVVATDAKLTLSWNASSDVTEWTVKRRDGGVGAWSAVAPSLPASTTSWDDAAIEKGKLYEYQVVRKGSATSGNAWVLAGREVPFLDDPGVVAVVVDAANATAASKELSRLEDDLAREGWEVARVTVDASAKPPDVRAQLQALGKKYGPRFRTAILLGAVPRAFSGLLNPDGHPDHRGAWPADGYYADLDGTWTDTSDLGGEGKFVNTAGDGKFDQTTYPSDLELAIGRVDTVGLPAFAPETPSSLLVRYLDADHAYRSAQKKIAERAFVSDNFGYFSGEAFARLAWRDSWAIYGADPAKDQPIFDALEAEGGYGFAIGCGGGTPTSAGGIGSTADFAKRAPQAVFLGLFGSYFGDWSYDDDFLRAALVSKGTALATAWFARPWHHFHPLGALKTFGETFLATANNKGTTYDVGNFPRSVHLALLGDPTLRIFVARAPTDLAAKGAPGKVTLSWSASPDATAGYHVYRREKDGGAETRLTTAPIAATTYEDAVEDLATRRYRVVAVRLRTTGSGTFYEHSPGPIVEGAAAASDAAPDAGSDPAPAADAPADDASGCGCRTHAGTNAGGGLAVALGLALFWRRRR